MRRSLKVKLAVVAVLAALFVAGWAFVYEPISAHSVWFRRVGADIRSLEHKRPPDVTRGQWEYLVGWTINLHGNAGGIWSSVDPAWQDSFEAELKQRLQGAVTLADIEWIWDEYAAHTKSGQSYSDRFRPTRSPDFQIAQPGCFGLRVE